MLDSTPTTHSTGAIAQPLAAGAQLRHDEAYHRRATQRHKECRGVCARWRVGLPVGALEPVGPSTPACPSGTAHRTSSLPAALGGVKVTPY